MEKRTLSIAETAKQLGLSRAFTYELANRGDIPVVRFGKRMVVPIVELDRYLSEHAS